MTPGHCWAIAPGKAPLDPGAPHPGGPRRMGAQHGRILTRTCQNWGERLSAEEARGALHPALSPPHLKATLALSGRRGTSGSDWRPRSSPSVCGDGSGVQRKGLPTSRQRSSSPPGCLNSQKVSQLLSPLCWATGEEGACRDHAAKPDLESAQPKGGRSSPARPLPIRIPVTVASGGVSGWGILSRQRQPPRRPSAAGRGSELVMRWPK